MLSLLALPVMTSRAQPRNSQKAWTHCEPPLNCYQKKWRGPAVSLPLTSAAGHNDPTLCHPDQTRNVCTTEVQF
jgi:hypothetical protein